MGRSRTRHTRGHRLAIAALALGISAAGVACSGGPSAKPLALKTTSAGQGSTPGSTQGSTAAGATATAGGSSATSSAPVPGTSAPTPATAAAPTSQTTHPTTAPPSHNPVTTQPAPAPTQPAPTSNGPQPTTPGTYQYNGSGTTTIETSSGTQSLAAATQTNLTISGGGSSEQWSNSVTTDNLTFNGSGVFLTAETLNSATGAGGTSCVFATPVAYPPWPLAVGKSSSGTANCGSGTLTVNVQVVSQSGANFVVKITQTSGSLKVTETDTYSPSLRMPIATSFVILGSYGSTAVSTQSSYTLA